MVLYKIVLGKESLIWKICIEERDMDRYEKPKVFGVRIDIWTHLMRECIMKLCTPI